MKPLKELLAVTGAAFLAYYILIATQAAYTYAKLPHLLNQSFITHSNDYQAHLKDGVRALSDAERERNLAVNGLEIRLRGEIIELRLQLDSAVRRVRDLEFREMPFGTMIATNPAIKIIGVSNAMRAILN